MNKIVGKINHFISPQFPIGIVFILAGVYVSWIAGAKLMDMYALFKPYFPFNAPPDFPEQMLKSLPAVFKYFIVIASSLCGVLVGALWVMTGLSDIFRRREKTPFVPDLDDPAHTADFLVSSEPQYWRRTSFILKFMGKHWSRARSIRPVSHALAVDLMKSSIKVVLVGFIIAVVLYLLGIVPDLVQKYFQTGIRLLVPSGRPLYFVVALIIGINILIILSLFPFRRMIFSRDNMSLRIGGAGTSQLYFALIEELCTLLTPRGLPGRRPIRMISSPDNEVRGSLIESHPEPTPASSRISAFLYLPLVYFPLTMGFSRLINFHRPVSQMPYHDFLALHLPDYVMETAFGVGLLIAGLYFAEWARRLFNVKRFRSFVIFCRSSKRPVENQRTNSAAIWTAAEGADERLASWAKKPDIVDGFNLEAYWAEGISEASSQQGRRSLVRIANSPDLDSFMKRIISLPLSIHFQAEPEKPLEKQISKPEL